MANRAKEKINSKNTKDKKLLDLDNEIIIGMKSLPTGRNLEYRKQGNSKSRTKKNKNTTNAKSKRNRNQEYDNNHIKDYTRENRRTTKTKKKKQEDEIELRLGIEEDSIKRKLNSKQLKIKPKKTEKELAIEKRKRKIIFRFIKWTSLVVLLIGGGIYFLLSPFFNIKAITTTGNEKITTEELVSLSGIQLEENTFKISTSKVEQAIKQNAYIESIKVKRKLPDSIELQVEERKPAYMIMLGNAYVYVNTQGYLLEVSKEALKLPILTGIFTAEDQIQEGNRLCAEDLGRLSSVIQIMDSANSNEIGSLITKINISDKQNYILELKSEKKNVHVGDTSNLGTKMLHVKTILEKEKKKEGDIIVNTDLSSKGAIFREKV